MIILSNVVSPRPLRPVNAESDRSTVLAALESVDGACIFAEPTATRFLAVAQPDVYVKGGDYTLETLNQDERRVVEQAGGKIVIIPLVPGKSPTATLKKSRGSESRTSPSSTPYGATTR